MSKSQFTLLASLFFFLFASCGEDAEVDKEKPTIDLTVQDAFPQNCETLYFGEAFDLKVLFADNVELGSFSIDIHHNFDHHSHTTEFASCDMDPKKTPVNPFVSIQDFEIPEGLSEYETNLSLTIPTEKDGVLLDEGDYHFAISLTDKAGWSTLKGLSIKILHR